MKFEKRLRALEAKMLTEPVTLHFADGTTTELHGEHDLLLHLFCASCSGADLDSRDARQLDLIRRCVAAEEPGGGRMVELIQGVLHGSAQTANG